MSKYTKTRREDLVPWRTNEVNVLLKAVKASTTMQSLCKVHRRTPESIKAKLNLIASDFYFTNPELFKQIQGLTGITEKEFLVDRGLLHEISPIYTSGSPKQFIEKDNVEINMSDLEDHIRSTRQLRHGDQLQTMTSNYHIYQSKKRDEYYEDIQIGICTNLALSILDTIIGSTIIIKNMINALNTAGQRN